ncbi:rhodanese-like domain-containing protein [Ectothiorhodospiraceae bacterium BW-2]|nr:rhodanese-like domain-containing protein [Ectothiorhodospiraceae bacterium BW-2]
MPIKPYHQLLALLLLCCAASLQAADDYLVNASPEHVNGATTINTTKAKELFNEGVIFIDVRSQMAFDKGRIPDAVLLDLKTDFTKENLAAEVAPSDPLIIYCQGPKCTRAAVAIEKALQWGYQEVYYYREGFPSWKEAGHPVE